MITDFIFYFLFFISSVRSQINDKNKRNKYKSNRVHHYFFNRKRKKSDEAKQRKKHGHKKSRSRSTKTSTSASANTSTAQSTSTNSQGDYSSMLSLFNLNRLNTSLLTANLLTSHNNINGSITSFSSTESKSPSIKTIISLNRFEVEKEKKIKIKNDVDKMARLSPTDSSIRSPSAKISPPQAITSPPQMEHSSLNLNYELGYYCRRSITPGGFKMAKETNKNNNKIN